MGTGARFGRTLHRKPVAQRPRAKRKPEREDGVFLGRSSGSAAPLGRLVLWNKLAAVVGSGRLDVVVFESGAE